ncbi:uncharacterized protein L203_105362 [Cryptococcus depauperatus CBS 7841]|uniref:Uncharacterized protein n=1 Tax=Cryptococcus depauperatus CBS 7841 TaxID=1295531 RepID=A0A1E3HLR4_9TREE|nr:hypothetical protein L203_06362 [Cryptococcus depauperatus CBS 7841]
MAYFQHFHNLFCLDGSDAEHQEQGDVVSLTRKDPLAGTKHGVPYESPVTQSPWASIVSNDEWTWSCQENPSSKLTSDYMHDEHNAALKPQGAEGGRTLRLGKPSLQGWDASEDGKGSSGEVCCTGQDGNGYQLPYGDFRPIVLNTGDRFSQLMKTKFGGDFSTCASKTSQSQGSTPAHQNNYPTMSQPMAASLSFAPVPLTREEKSHSINDTTPRSRSLKTEGKHPDMVKKRLRHTMDVDGCGMMRVSQRPTHLHAFAGKAQLYDKQCQEHVSAHGNITMQHQGQMAANRGKTHYQSYTAPAVALKTGHRFDQLLDAKLNCPPTEFQPSGPIPSATKMQPQPSFNSNLSDYSSTRSFSSQPTFSLPYAHPSPLPPLQSSPLHTDLDTPLSSSLSTGWMHEQLQTPNLAPIPSRHSQFCNYAVQCPSLSMASLDSITPGSSQQSLPHHSPTAVEPRLQDWSKVHVQPDLVAPLPMDATWIRETSEGDRSLYQRTPPTPHSSFKGYSASDKSTSNSVTDKLYSCDSLMPSLPLPMNSPLVPPTDPSMELGSCSNITNNNLPPLLKIRVHQKKDQSTSTSHMSLAREHVNKIPVVPSAMKRYIVTGPEECGMQDLNSCGNELFNTIKPFGIRKFSLKASVPMRRKRGRPRKDRYDKTDTSNLTAFPMDHRRSSENGCGDCGRNQIKHGKNGKEILPKTSIACQFCRLKKLKCDGVKPRCFHCVKRGEEVCEYEAVLRRRGPGKQNRKRLELS